MGVNGRTHGDDALARALVGKPVRRLFLAVTVLGGLGAVGGVSLSPTVRYLPLALSVVLLGLPHGAVDHLVPARLEGRALPVLSARQSALAVGVGYLLLGGAYALVWLRAPVAAAVGFVGLTWFHWGQGDLWVLRRLYGASYLRHRGLGVATLVVRGGLPMLVPLLVAPARYRAVLSAWVGLFEASLGRSWLFAVETRVALGVGFAALTLGTLTAGRLAVETETGQRAWRADAAEVGVLWAFFLAVPPLPAIGLYFTCWHALRHVVRLLLLDDGFGGPVRDSPRAIATRLERAGARFARDALPLTLLSLVLLVGFGAVVPGSVQTVPEYAALYLVFVAVVTLPHVVVVTLMDHAEGVWTGAGAQEVETDGTGAVR